MNLQFEKSIGISSLIESGCKVNYFSLESDKEGVLLVSDFLQINPDFIQCIYTDDSNPSISTLKIFRVEQSTVVVFSSEKRHKAFELTRYDLYREGHKNCCRLCAKLKFSENLFSFLNSMLSSVEDSPGFIDFGVMDSSVKVLADLFGPENVARSAQFNVPSLKPVPVESTVELTRDQKIAEILDKSSRKRLG